MTGWQLEWPVGGRDQASIRRFGDPVTILPRSFLFSWVVRASLPYMGDPERSAGPKGRGGKILGFNAKLGDAWTLIGRTQLVLVF